MDPVTHINHPDLSIAELNELLEYASEEERAEFMADLDEFVERELPIFTPQPGGQLSAYESEADVTGMGGQAGSGKGLALDTPIPTPDGWTTMGELKAGDEVFDRDGEICSVVKVSGINRRPCYRLVFDDGTEIVADDEHLWVTYTAKELNTLRCRSPEGKAARRAKRPSRATGARGAKMKEMMVARNKEQAERLRESNLLPSEGAVRTTKEIFETAVVLGSRTNHAIRVCGALQTRQADLPIPPYTLGAWLGDGTSKSGAITGIDPEIWRRIEEDGFVVRHSKNNEKTHGVLGLQVRLREAGVLKNKHVPKAYLRASPEQRLAILQGLMDTDGCATLAGSSEFDNINEGIIDGVLELVRSLGIKATKLTGLAKLNGRVICKKWRVRYTTNKPVFSLPRKADRIKGKRRRSTLFRYIVRCEEIESVPTQCIEVDSPSRTYLASEAMIPTHNSGLICGLALTKHQRTLIMRREATQLSGIRDDLVRMVGHRDGLNEQRGVWRNPVPGRIIEFGSLPNPGDETKYQGRPHDLLCVAGNTPVRMADGAYKLMSQVKTGDLVDTLHGARKVTKVFPVRRDRAVRVDLLDARGGVVYSQEQSLTHEMLMPPSVDCGVTEGRLFRFDSAKVGHVDVLGLTWSDPRPLLPLHEEANPRSPIHIFHRVSYVHPYRRDVRPTDATLCSFAYSAFEIGEIDLYDIEVEDANHYVTGPGIVNKNCIDEATEMREKQVRFIMGWVRSVDPEQRCRVVFTFNPPEDAEGMWVVRFFAPWIDDTYQGNKALPGELRWFATVDGEDIELADNRPFVIEDGEVVYEFDPEMYGPEYIIKPSSRTFIPGKLVDNIFLGDGYMRQLQALPEELRNRMLHGRFTSFVRDDPMQVIPTEWVQAAMDRWTDPPGPRPPMDSVGVDVARGGKDYTEIAVRHGWWFGRPVSHKGSDTPDGATAAAYVMHARRDDAPVHIDAIGVGTSPTDKLVEWGVHTVPVIANQSALTTDRSGLLRFSNVRSYMWWNMREKLDPAGGFNVALPPDKQLKEDLAAMTYVKRGLKIYCLSREELIKKIGRSPDRGTAFVQAALETPRRRQRKAKTQAREEATMWELA